MNATLTEKLRKGVKDAERESYKLLTHNTNEWADAMSKMDAEAKRKEADILMELSKVKKEHHDVCKTVKEMLGREKVDDIVMDKLLMELSKKVKGS